MNIKDLDNNIDVSNNTEIDIQKLLNELEHISNEKEKDDFIKNYSRINEQIKIVDSIIYKDTDTGEQTNNSETEDNETEDNETEDINKLLSVLEDNEEKIFNSDNLNVFELKSLIQICDKLERKINKETMNIIEIKN